TRSTERPDPQTLWVTDGREIDTMPWGDDVPKNVSHDGAVTVERAGTYSTGYVTTLTYRGRQPETLDPKTSYRALSPTGEHRAFSRPHDFKSYDDPQYVGVRNTATGAETIVAERRPMGGTDFHLAVVVTSPRWSLSGRFLAVVADGPDRDVYKVVVYDAVTDAKREFSASCKQCGRFFSWWAPDGDRITVPTGSTGTAFERGLYDARAGQVLPIGSGPLTTIIAGSTVGEIVSKTQTRVRDLVTGTLLADWRHRADTGGYEGIGRQHSFATADGKPVFAVRVSNRDFSRPLDWAQCGAEVFHPRVPSGRLCIDGPVDWVAWSPDGAKLAVTYRSATISRSGISNEVCEVRIFDVAPLREIVKYTPNKCSVTTSLVPVWSGDGKSVWIYKQGTQI
ncbi:MAG: hypothetical protein WCI61_09455, partial [Chloroflexota bacterium]